MFTEVLIAVLVILLGLVWFRNRSKTPHNYPRGPRTWPVFGNWFQLGSPLHLYYTELSKIYGDVYSLRIFSQNVVVLNSYKALSEAMVDRGSDFAGRPAMNFLSKFTNMYMMTTQQDYTDVLKLHRKLAQTAMRMHGKEAWVEIITRQVDNLLANWTKKENSGFDPHISLRMVAFNTLTSLAYGVSYSEDDHDFLKYMINNREMLSLYVSLQFLNIFPWMSPMYPTKLRQLRVQYHSWYEFIESKVKEHKATFDRENPRDMIDFVLLAREDLDRKDVSEEVFNTYHLTQFIESLIGAGSETTVEASKWFLVDLMNHPMAQKKIHQELDDVIGPDSRPLYSDHDSLPYLEAAMYETLRLHTIAPLSVPHRTIRDSSVGGYDIPENTRIISNSWAIDHDDRVFTDPYSYKPERFINPDTGKLLSYTEMNFAPFGMGRRVCLGEMFARMEYFLIAANICHQFEVSVPPGENNPSMLGNPGITYQPHPYKLQLKRRNVNT